VEQITGSIITWNDDRGYGFIAVDKSSTKKYFVHISGFGQIPRRPLVGDVVRFVSVESMGGKQQAVNVRIAGLPPQVAPTRSGGATPAARPRRRVLPSESGRRGRHWIGSGFALSLAIGAGIYAYDSFPPNWIKFDRSTQSPTTVHATSEPRFRCAGKIYCSEMSSCKEAIFYLRNCPGTKMDGNHDGVPCESQWCGQ